MLIFRGVVDMQDAAVGRDGLSTYEPWNKQILGQPHPFRKAFHELNRLGFVIYSYCKKGVLMNDTFLYI